MFQSRERERPHLQRGAGRGGQDAHEVRLGAEPGEGVWRAGLCSARGPLEQVCLTCVCGGCAPPARLMEHMGTGALRHSSCHSQQAAPPSLSPRNVAAPGHYSSAVTFSLVLVGRL